MEPSTGCGMSGGDGCRLEFRKVIGRRWLKDQGHQRKVARINVHGIGEAN